MDGDEVRRDVLKTVFGRQSLVVSFSPQQLNKLLLCIAVVNARDKTS